MKSDLYPAAPGQRWTGPLVAALFTLSGACALVYQLGWVRRFTLEFGSTSLAVSSVVAVFMGGLALGAVAGGRLGAGLRRPLRTYGQLECLLALFAGLSPWTFPWLLAGLSTAAASVEESFAWIAVARLFGAVLLILPPTLLMGATLPFLSAWVERRRSNHAKGAGTLYGLNTLGAMAGVLAGGFLLLPELGMKASLLIAAGANLGLGLACIAISRAGGETPEGAAGAHAAGPSETLGSDEASAVSEEARGSGTAFRDSAREPSSSWLGLAGAAAVVGLAGAGSMACQVLWTRVASLVLGASAYSFTIVLATFLAGLGIGAVAVTRLLGWRPRWAGGLLWGLLVAGAVAVAASGWLFPQLPVWAVALYHSFEVAEDGARATRLQMVLAAALLLPPTIFFGGVFPAALAALTRPGRVFCAEVGRLYAWNTLGCIVGVLAGGFLLLPLLGPRDGLMVAAGAILLAGVLHAAGSFSKGRAWAATGLALAVGAATVVWTPAWDRHLMTSGPHSYAESYGGYGGVEELSRHLGEIEELLYYADGLVATITVARQPGYGEPVTYLSTDGKIDGSSHSDMPTQRLSAHLPMLLHPNPKEICVIGIGTGCTGGSAALHPGTQVRVVEIERRMVEAAEFFREHNHDLHRRENAEIVVSDGRLHLLTRRDSYDVIISAPSNPWLAGTSDLFTADFFGRASAALREGGIFAQWIQLYGMSEENFRIAVRGFLDVFPEVCLATTIPEIDVLLIGSREPFVIDPAAIGARLAAPEIAAAEIAADLADSRVGVHGVEELLARVRMAPEQVRAYVGEGERHTDDRPILAYRAARDLPRDTGGENDAAIARHARGIAELLRFPASDDGKARQRFLEGLALAYRDFRPDGGEARATEALLEGVQ